MFHQTLVQSVLCQIARWSDRHFARELRYLYIKQKLKHVALQQQMRSRKCHRPMQSQTATCLPSRRLLILAEQSKCYVAKLVAQEYQADVHSSPSEASTVSSVSKWTLYSTFRTAAERFISNICFG